MAEWCSITLLLDGHVPTVEGFPWTDFYVEAVAYALKRQLRLADVPRKRVCFSKPNMPLPGYRTVASNVHLTVYATVANVTAPPHDACGTVRGPKQFNERQYGNDRTSHFTDSGAILNSATGPMKMGSRVWPALLLFFALRSFFAHRSTTFVQGILIDPIHSFPSGHDETFYCVQCLHCLTYPS